MAKKIPPWDPVVDCIGPLIEALNPLKFKPPLSSCPDLTNTYHQLDVELCCLWLQECMNPATAADFKNRLDSCLHHWVALVSPERWSGRWGWNFQQWQDWWNEPSKDNLWWKETWDEITDEFEQMIEYLQKLAALIEAKVAARKRKGQDNVRERGHSAEVGGGQIDEKTVFSPKQLTERFGVPLGPLQKRLARLRGTNHNCFIELTNRGPKPQFLYYVDAVVPIIKDLKNKTIPTSRKTSSKTSSKRPA